MRFILQVLAAVALVIRNALAESGTILDNKRFGGSRGHEFSDKKVVVPGQIPRAPHIRAGERVNGVGIDFTNNYGLQTSLYHGGGGGNRLDLKLGEGEYITAVEAHTGEKDGKTRIVYIQFLTNKGDKSR